ncbi:MAG TPA: hypothetical protein PLV83_01180 [Bacilli bacterium]|nr:hypothetical protein [Bacilli bacterium]
MHEQLITTIDYAKLIKIQANQICEYEKAVRLDNKKTEKSSSYLKNQKVKTIGRRK